MGLRRVVSWIAPATVAVALLALSSPSLAKGGVGLHAPAAEGETQEPAVALVPSVTPAPEGKAGRTIPASPPPPSAKERSSGGIVPPAPDTGSPAGVIVVAAGMGAVVLALVQLVVIARLRRRLAEMGSPRVPDGAGPPLAGVEQT